jgi:glycosyltransferase involved in cell wall biosynthesis
MIPKVSVIITCYNQQAYIAQAIESVMNQTFSDWECIIIDDGSTDISNSLYIKYAEKDNRIKYQYQDNQGVSIARNTGFKLSKGEFIQFLDGDDFISFDKLERQVEYMIANHQYGVTYSNHQHYWQNSDSLAQYSFEILEEHPLQQFLFRYDRGVSMPIHTALLRRSIWDAHELPFPTDYNHRYEDWIFWVQIALKGVRFRFLDQNLAVYRMHTDNFITGTEQIAVNALYATNYINSLIPLSLREEFQYKSFDFFLKRYIDSKIKSLTFTFHLQQLLSVPFFLLRKVKRNVGIMIKRVRKL